MPFYKRFLSLLLALTVMLPLAAVAEDAAPPSPWTVTLDEILGVIPFQEGFLVAYTQHLEYCCPEAQTVQRIPLEKGEQVYLMAYDAPNQRALLYLSQAGQEACQAVWMRFENGLFSRANAFFRGAQRQRAAWYMGEWFDDSYPEF